MKKITPLLTEKSIIEAKKGFYSFLVPTSANKYEIREAIGKAFKVKVKSVRTVNFKGGVKRNVRGQFVKFVAYKKAIVCLTGKEKIDIFEENVK